MPLYETGHQIRISLLTSKGGYESTPILPLRNTDGLVCDSIAENRPFHSKPPVLRVLSEMASLEKSRNSLRTGGWRRASFHASL
jgi:hypothetical protein